MNAAPKNPFLIVGYHSPDYFCDRQKETETILSALENERNITLISPRRMGKTGLIKHSFYQMQQQEPAAACYYMDIFATQNLQEFVSLLAKTTLGTLDTFSQQLMGAVFSFFKSCRPVITADEITGTPSLSLDFVADKSMDTLKEIFTYLNASSRPCYIAIDEFQQILEYPEKGIEALLRSYIQFTPNVHFLFSGSKKHLMEAIFSSSRRPFYHSTQKLSLERIALDKYQAFATAHFAAAGKELPADVFVFLYEQMDGHTWYVQYLLNRLFVFPQEQLVRESVIQIINETLKEEEYTYQTYFQLLTSNQIQLLKAVAREGVVAEVNANSFIKKYNLKGASSVNTALKALIDKEFVLKQTDGYVVYDRFMDRWLKQQF